MSLVTIAEARALGIGASLVDVQLQAIIDREELALTTWSGGPIPDGATARTETLRPDTNDVFVQYPIVSISSITEAPYVGAVAITLLATQYYAWLAEGRIERLPAISSGVPAWPGRVGRWGDIVTVAYVPIDDRARARGIILELIQQTTTATGLHSESIAGEYSYTALPNSDARRAAIYRAASYFRRA